MRQAGVFEQGISGRTRQLLGQPKADKLWIGTVRFGAYPNYTHPVSTISIVIHSPGGIDLIFEVFTGCTAQRYQPSTSYNPADGTSSREMSK